jgi:hypothetical protein
MTVMGEPSGGLVILKDAGQRRALLREPGTDGGNRGKGFGQRFPITGFKGDELRHGLAMPCDDEAFASFSAFEQFWQMGLRVVGAYRFGRD